MRSGYLVLSADLGSYTCMRPSFDTGDTQQQRARNMMKRGRTPSWYAHHRQRETKTEAGREIRADVEPTAGTGITSMRPESPQSNSVHM